MANPLEARKHFEAVRVDLAKRLNIDHADLREDIKAAMKELKIIQFSTTELKEEELEAYANKLHKFVFDFDALPPDERPVFDLKKLLLS